MNTREISQKIILTSISLIMAVLFLPQMSAAEEVFDDQAPAQPQEVVAEQYGEMEAEPNSDELQPMADIASGIAGNCTWRITSSGELIITAVSGTDGMLSSAGTTYDSVKKIYITNEPWGSYVSQIKTISIGEGVASGLGAALFAGCVNATQINGLANLDTSQTKYASCMFGYCSSLTSLDISSFDTTSMLDISLMFAGCTSLESVNMSGLENQNVKLMNSMFVSCTSLKSIDLTGFQTHAATAMYWMFFGCSSLRYLDVSGFDTSKVETMYSMFNGCTSLESLDLTNFDTSSATAMDYMFNYTGLRRITLGLKFNFNGSGSTMLTQLNAPIFAGASGSWYSPATKTVYSPTEIATLRNNIEDTYYPTIDLSYATLDPIDNQAYYGSAVRPKTRVVFDGEVLVEGVDYKWTYADTNGSQLVPINTGTYRAVANGMGRCTNTQTFVLFNVAASITSASVTGVSASYIYTGNSIQIKPIVKLGIKTLQSGSDYSVRYVDASGATVMAPVDMGAYTLKVIGCDAYGGTIAIPFAVVRNGAATVNRLWGNSALDTMQTIVQGGFSGIGGTVVLATLDNFPDALTAAGIAGLAEAPVLLTDGAVLSTQTATELARLKPATIIICGGTSAVSDAVANAAKTQSGATRVVRCAGMTRSGTACEIFKKAIPYTGVAFGATAFIATGANFADALAIAPYAYAKGCPVFLSEGAAYVSDETISTMRSGGIKSFYVLGGTAAVSDDVVMQLTSEGLMFKGRLSGANRYETSQRIAEFELSAGMRADRMAIATGRNYKDALTGAALCGKSRSVLVLVADDNRLAIDGFMKSNKLYIRTSYVFGGTASISQDTETYVANTLA